MRTIKFGRQRFSFEDGKTELVSTSITIRAFANEDEQAFTERLLELCGNKRGTIEIIFKTGRPDYAIITFK